MFKEHTGITLTASIPLESIFDVPPDSLLLKDGNPEDGLLPGDVGIIVDIHPGRKSFLVEFLEPNGYTAALADVLESQARPTTDADRAAYRFRKERLLDPGLTRGDTGPEAHIFEQGAAITLTDPIPLEYIYAVPAGSPLRDAANPEEGLLPGDVGCIVHIYPWENDLMVEFFATDGSTVAVTDVWASQARPATDEDRAKYRFGEKATV